MSKITISAILAIVRLVLGVLAKAVKLIDVIRDLIDDGKINSSLSSLWSDNFEKVNLQLSDLIDSLMHFESFLPEELTEDTSVYGLESSKSEI